MMKDEQGAGQPSSVHSGAPQSPETSLAMQPSLFHSSGRPTWVEINLDHLAHNFHLVKQTLGEGIAIMPAIKADAYGHSAIHCASRLEREGADWFGIALPEEGLALREAGITKPILCLGGFWEG